MATFTNLDGLPQRYGTDRASDTLAVNETGSLNRLVVKLNNAANIDANDDDPMTATGMAEFKDENTPFLPAKSYITRAYFVVTTAFAGSSGALDIGLMQADGTVVDIDAIDDGIAVTAIDAVGDVVNCNGAAVGGVVKTSATLDTYVCFTEDPTNAFTAGAGYLVLEYFQAP